MKFYSIDYVPHFLAYLGGVVTGASAKYFADKYTDKRRKKEASKLNIKNYISTASNMPWFIMKLKSNIDREKAKIISSFYVYPNKRKSKMKRGSRNIIYEDDYRDFKDNLSLLENSKFIFQDKDERNKFHLSSEFIKLIKSSKIKDNRIVISKIQIILNQFRR